MVQKFLIALALVGVVDSVSYMVVAPSIVFYVLENGGTKEQYGIILSAFSFASFCAKPFLGFWSDKYGFRLPYLVTLSLSAVGGFFYLIAGAYDDQTAVALILTARLLGGIGAASAALGFAYLAKVVPHEEQTKINSVLSMTRILGMASGPGFNVFLAKVDTTWFGLHIETLNSVGLILIGSNVMAMLFIYFLLDDPEEDHSVSREESTHDDTNSLWKTIRGLLCLEVLVPIFSIFTFNANFQLIETGFAPAANHALGWTPVAVSGVLGSVSIIIFMNMMIVFWLSARKVRDESLLIFGSSLSIVGYFLVWDLWRWESSAWNFVVPIVLGVSSFPFLAAPTRSVFTKAVDRNELLSANQGAMQALLSMFASVAGFVTPGLVAAYVLRSPEEVEHSLRHRELSAYALVAPLLMMFVLIGVILVNIKNGRKQIDDDVGSKDASPDEKTSLMESQSVKAGETGEGHKKNRCSAKIEVDRRISVKIMGIVQTSMYDEQNHSSDEL